MTRGRTATRPSEIPAKGLLDVAMRIWNRQGTANLGLIAAGIAFYGLLSLFPAITSGVALAGLFMERNVIVENSSEFAAVLPNAAQDIILGQMRDVASADETALGFAALFALALALYSASKAIANMISGLNIVYEEHEDRGFLKLKALTLGLTAFTLGSLILALGVVAILPAIAAFVGVTPFLSDLILLGRWPLMFCVGVACIAVLYRYGPDRRAAKWRWLTPGAVIACLLWVAGSIAFSTYVQSFGTYNETFGALGGVIVLLTWLWLSAFVVLLGALLDAELEAQTARDSTIGAHRPLGERGAYKADNLGDARSDA
ncbi:YihY/virulence factor BrkB family protein [Marivita sp. S6314]|uniref:YihY/virulence factor BrkB family protein n=1 Tax=Marivita sp. S6314 TaxID=2926406 RepID=UPI001FF1DAC2|nr:YihY/virulence factor BrkB family protein [Marivita sp. S6314]MCK0149523.1 YihY/virulence factor BrkB family protein [Marivita sp. S6314]